MFRCYWGGFLTNCGNLFQPNCRIPRSASRCFGALVTCLTTYASLDVVSLYSNIPIDESIDATVDLLEIYHRDVNMFYLSSSEARKLLKFGLQLNYFEFGQSVSLQTTKRLELFVKPSHSGVHLSSCRSALPMGVGDVTF